jgi:putative phosphoserine phosphatase/1-acylglycerol-3-phosphate O-acyltransferase
VTTTPAPASALAAPGGVEQVLASPPGAHIAAVFDLDGTLVAGYTALIFAEDRYRRLQARPGELARTVTLGMAGLVGRASFADLIALAASTWKGRTFLDVQALGQRLFDTKIADRIYPEVMELLAAHRSRGHTIVLASSATIFQVGPVARFLGIDNILCSQLEIDADGILTGQVVDPMMWGDGKARAVQTFAASADIELEASYFYADGDEDEALMHLVGNPRPTNPGRRLAGVANRRGWPVQRYSSRGPGRLTAVARNLAGHSAVVPIGALAAGAGLLNGNRRMAVDLASASAIDLLLAAAGVQISATGLEHLVAKRPAVFIWNHRNNFDPVVVGKLVRAGFTGVAKKELRRDPLFGVAGRLLDVVFVDREDTSKAIESLVPLERLITQGVSVLIAPEGTRSADGELGSFKKGAFRIAMGAGIPIVPVVIRNASVLGPRNANFMRSGKVDVVVLPPVEVDEWGLHDLDERIDGVRQLFVDTLADWPGTYS